MSAKLDIVGHFGTTFSYATVGSRVAQALRGVDRLGNVQNLDAAWHESFGWLKERSTEPSNKHVLLFTAPHHYVDVYASQYGREHSALFMSPNTDALATEHAETAVKFGLLICPSAWCAQTVRASLSPETSRVVVLPLGADDGLFDRRFERLTRIMTHDGSAVRALHLSSDQSWPGRKGSEELLVAWGELMGAGVKAELTFHVPRALRADATYLIRHMGVEDSVDLRSPPERGSHPDDLAKLFDECDLLVAPSRCEGFGIMMLSALAAGVPLVCHPATGPHHYLRHLDGWVPVSAVEWGDLRGEHGQAPVIDIKSLVNTLYVTLLPESVQFMASIMSGAADLKAWLWSSVLSLWTEELVAWLDG